MLACVAAGSTFFPTAYHSGPTTLSLGLQGVGIIAGALRRIPGAERETILDPVQITQWVRNALIEHATPVVEMGQKIAGEYALHFGGIDLSPAPLGDDSIVAAM